MSHGYSGGLSSAVLVLRGPPWQLGFEYPDGGARKSKPKLKTTSNPTFGDFYPRKHEITNLSDILSRWKHL